jgi:hypothetical protein
MNTCHVCGETLPDNCAQLNIPQARLDRAAKHLFKFMDSQTQRYGMDETFVYLALFYILLTPPPQIHVGDSRAETPAVPHSSDSSEK